MEAILNKSVFLFLLAIVVVGFSGCKKEEKVVEEKQGVAEVIETEENNDSLEDIDDELVTITTEEINEEFELKAKMDTSDWLTYRNEEYGFEVRYPRDWRADETYGDDKKNTGDIVEGLILSAPGDFQGGGTWRITIEDNCSLNKIVNNYESFIDSDDECDDLNIKKSIFNNAEVLYMNYICNNDLVKTAVIKEKKIFTIGGIDKSYINFKLIK